MKSPVLLLSGLLDDVERLEPDVIGLDRDLLTIESRFKHEGYGFLSVTLSALCDAFDTGISTGRFTCPSSFSKVRGGAIPKFLQGLLCKVFDPKTGLLLDNCSVHAVKCVREITRLFKKIQLSPRREALLHKEAIHGFFATDDKISKVVFPRDKLNLLRAVSRLVMPNLDRFDMATMAVKHGPGGVYERVKTNQKWLALIEACQRDPFLSVKFGFDILTSDGQSTADYRSVQPLSFQDMLYDADQANGLVPRRDSSGIAKLLTVPKNSTSLRTITMEPVLNMFVQQGLNTVLRDNILSCRILSSCLALTDQSKNQHLAMVGSLTDEYATIDLSSASDLLGLNLVEEVFASKPTFLTCALDCRSSHVESDLTPAQRVLKFAGMGNALTFPVQSITFALLAICGVLCCEGRRPSYGNVVRAARRVRVYGDDIIVETRHVHQVVDWLTSFGLCVNQKKSFLKGNFKESCGVDAFKGHDVTPIYIRHEPIISERNPEQIASLVSSSNQAWLKGLYGLATVIRDCVEEVLPLPLVSASSAALGWHSRVDTTIAQKWDRKLQRLVFRGHVVEPIRRPDHIDGYAALMMSLHALETKKSLSYRPGVLLSFNRRTVRDLTNISSVDGKRLERSVMRFNTKFRIRWVPAQAGVL